jgi:hypothetical protein
MSLDDQIADYLAKTDARQPRSKLEPYAELIRGLRQRRWTYQRIAAALKEQFGVIAVPSTIHDFVRVRARAPRPDPHPERATSEPPTPGPRKPRFHLEM